MDKKIRLKEELQLTEAGRNFLEAANKLDVIKIPNGATNGNMIRLMFPYGKYGTNGNEVHVYGVGGNGCLVFTLDWWNAPYKRMEE